MTRSQLLIVATLLSTTGCGPRSPRTLDEPPDELGRKLRAGDISTRRDAAFTLSRLAQVGGRRGDRDKPIGEKPALREALRDQDYVTRIFAAHALADMGGADAEVRKVYADAVTHEDSWARVQACCGVRSNPELLATSIPVLEMGLDDPDDAVASEAAQSLAECDVLDGQVVLDKLLSVVRRAKSTPGLQEDALRALGKADATHARVILEQIRTVDCHRSEHFDVEPAKEKAIAALTKTLGSNGQR
jgi:hypothetical protein